MERNNEIIRKYNLSNGQGPTVFNLKCYVMLVDAFENFGFKYTLEYEMNPLYSYSTPGFTWRSGSKHTSAVLEYLKGKDFLLLLENYPWRNFKCTR